MRQYVRENMERTSREYIFMQKNFSTTLVDSRNRKVTMESDFDVKFLATNY